ncbi:MAG: nucleoside recognition domain-containing protein [bacterium]|nr:nucleoside recognition domain-containing protein [bacterium]
MQNQSNDSRSFLKFLVFSALGIFIFFVPAFTRGKSTLTFMVYAVDSVKAALLPVLPIITMLLIFSLVILCIIAKCSNNHPTIKRLYGSSNISIFLYCMGAVLGTMAFTKVGPQILFTKGVMGGVSVAQTVVVTTLIAGMMVPFLVEFGLLEMIGQLIEPFMRPLFKIPGCASIDAVTSFVANPTVGVFFTNKLYCEKLYTGREAASIATCFSFISLGFFAVPCQVAGIFDLYGTVLLSSFAIAFILAAIMIRIPPISKIEDKYIDGSPRDENAEHDKSQGNLFLNGLKAAISKAQSTDILATFKKYFIDVFVFTQKVTATILCFCMIAMLLVENTSIFHVIGTPFIPLLKLLQIPNASEIGPAMILALAEVSLPSVYISTLAVARKTAFFVVVLSTLQIINLGSSMMPIIESRIPLNAVKCLIIFILRTIIAIPIVALLAHLMF